jgi:hypothetical protein
MQIIKAYLCGDISDGCRSGTCHVMETSISRTSSFGLLVHRAGRCEYMLEGLQESIRRRPKRYETAYIDDKVTP